MVACVLMTMQVWYLRRLPECQRYLFEVADEDYGPVARSLEGLGRTGRLVGWEVLGLERFPDSGAATTRFGYMAGQSSVVVYPKVVVPEFPEGAPGFVVVPTVGEMGVGMVPATAGVVARSDDEIAECFVNWPAREVSLDFVVDRLPVGSFFAASTSLRTGPVGLLFACEDGAQWPPLFELLVEDGGGWYATEVWSSVDGPIRFWR